ncbi:MAG: pyruvate kinase [Anaerolineae bacterium]|nr:MAG: pyruvate kinase [Anaerolineae bacterium]
MKLSELLPKKTKIICTIGPASRSQDVLEKLMLSGMNIARINFAHGDLEGHRQVIANIRGAAEVTGQHISIFGDLPGPKMRIGLLKEEPIVLERGQEFSLHSDEIIGDKERVSISFKDLPGVVEPGDNLFINDGYIQLEVEGVENQVVRCRVLVGGELRSNNGLNLPDIDLGISAFTDRDLVFLRFAAAQNLDGVSQSFAESENDIFSVREAAEALDYYPFVIAKIERARALDNLPGILDAADGIMVARGDLGVEIPIERIATSQKKIIAAANLSGKPVITATHMLESMIEHRRPTRAEATDVANAILDGTDCVMLSGETAIGKFPVEAVAMMTNIARETESFDDGIGVADFLEIQKSSGKITRDDLIAYDIYKTAQTLSPVVVFVPSDSGETARQVTRFRLKPWIVAISQKERTCQHLQFSYGVYPQYLAENPESWSKYAQDWLVDNDIDCDLVMVCQSASTNRAGDTMRLEIISLA